MPFALAVAGLWALVASPDRAFAQRCIVAEVEVGSPLNVVQGVREPIVVTFRDRNSVPCIDEPNYTVVFSPTGIATFAAGRVTGVRIGTTIMTVRTGTGRNLKQGQGVVNVVSADVARPENTPGPEGVVRTDTVSRASLDPRLRAYTGPGAATLLYQPDGTAPAAGIEVDPRELLLLPGEARALVYHTADRTGGPAERLPMLFAVTPANGPVMVDTLGGVTVRDTGRATITVTAAGRSGIFPGTVTVVVRADTVAFRRTLLAMVPGTVDTVRLRVPAQNRDIEGRLFRYTSSDTNVVRVNLYEPVIEARAVGRAVITAEAASPTLPAVRLPVRVFRPVTRIALGDTVLTLAIRQSRSVRMRPEADTMYIPEAPREVRGLDSTKVRVAWDSVAGSFTFTGLASGATSLTMRVQNGRDSIGAVEQTLRIRVVAGGLLASTRRTGMGLTERVLVSVQLLDDRRQPLAGVSPDLTWSSSAADSAVARYENGHIVARGVGHARITGRTPWDSAVAVDAYVVGDMVLSRNMAGQTDLYTRGSAGWQRLTSDSLAESFPAIAPDLTRLAYVVRRGGGADLMVANADGLEARRVFSDSGEVQRVVWVRTTGALVWEMVRHDTSQIWTANADGSNARRLALGPPGTIARMPSVSPDGRSILFVSLREVGGSRSYDVYMANLADGSQERRLAASQRSDDSPAFHPDGTSFFFLRDEGQVNRQPTKRVYLYNLLNDSATALTPDGMFVQSFGVSGDGSTLALTVLEASTRLVLFDVAARSAAPVAPEADERLGPTPASMRPALPAAAPAGAAPTPAPRP